LNDLNALNAPRTAPNGTKAVKGTFWGVAAFYFLVAFEFFYMASPFAVYFYSVYAPVLDFFNASPLLAGLVSYFMPHFSATSSLFLNVHNYVGAVLAVLGFFAFCAGAFQVYYHKLARKGIVTGGVYNYIRHPQYASFILCSFGLLLLWPRYIALVMFVTMLFAYYLLARAEERECAAKFGQSYIDYRNKTNMFLPFKLPLKLVPIKSKAAGLLGGIALYLLVMAAAFSLAGGLDNLTKNSLYTVYTSNSATISICRLEQDEMEKILRIALAEERVKDKLSEAAGKEQVQFLNYILPSEWYAAEVPMNGIVRGKGHSMPAGYDRNSFKVIFTEADLRKDGGIFGKDILRNVTARKPLAEVWVDLAEGRVTRVLDMPEKVSYENIPVALY
jgi:protein-S-isoprenylcysteine O-methyltransferase Ste14